MAVNFQDAYLSQIKNQSVTVYLANGYALKGLVRAYDTFTVLLETSEDLIQLIYKHSVVSIKPNKPQGDAFIGEVFKSMKEQGK